QERWKNAKPILSDDDKDGLLRDTLNQNFSAGYDRKAGILDLAEKTGAPADLVEMNYDKMKADFETSSVDIRKWRRDNPSLSEAMLRRPELAPIMFKDEHLSSASKVWRAIDAMGTLTANGVEINIPEEANLPWYTRAAIGWANTE